MSGKVGINLPFPDFKLKIQKNWVNQDFFQLSQDFRGKNARKIWGKFGIARPDPAQILWPSWPVPDPSCPNFCRDFVPLEISRQKLVYPLQDLVNEIKKDGKVPIFLTKPFKQIIILSKLINSFKAKALAETWFKPTTSQTLIYIFSISVGTWNQKYVLNFALACALGTTCWINGQSTQGTILSWPYFDGEKFFNQATVNKR